MAVPEPIEALACRLGLYSPARDAFDRFLRPERFRARERFRQFFAQFVTPGSKVFDVGAHLGRWTDRFVELGAAVVAVEPIPEFARSIARRHGSRVAVERAALGAARGHATLQIGRLTEHSSLAPRWIEFVRSEGGERWTREIVVDVLTLDDLIDRHGVPDFTKIDVEGYEPEVFRGLSRPLPLLSFEAQTRAPSLARECIDRLSELGQYEFNVVRGIDLRLALDSWVGGREALEIVEAIDPRSTGTADVFARLTVAA